MRLRSVLVVVPFVILSSMTSLRVASADTAAVAVGESVQQKAPPGKAPIPAAAALKKAAQLVEDVYKDDISAAKTPEQKLAVAQKMLDATKDEKDPATVFTLLTKALNLACQAGDFQSACVVADSLAQDFLIDALRLKADGAAFVSKVAATPEQRKAFVSLAAPLVDAAVGANRYDIAKSVGVTIVEAARETKDAPLLADAEAHLQQVRSAEEAHAEAQQALQILAGKPNDPRANLKAGTYYCFIKGNWDRGLPMLALSSDEVLKPLAKTELAGPTTVDDQVKLADAWSDLSEKNAGPARAQLQAHAAEWYQAALPNLVGLSKIRVEKRLAQTTPNVPAETGIIAEHAGHRTIDLLALVDLTKDTVRGRWVAKAGVLTGQPGEFDKLNLSYRPPEEYDYRVEFTRDSGNGCVGFILAAAGKQFVCQIGGWENTVIGFEMVGGVGANSNRTTVHEQSVLTNGKRYEAVVKVRKGGVEAYLDGKLVTKLDTDYSNVNIWEGWRISDEKALGLASDKSTIRFFRADVTEVTGKGEITRPPASANSVNLLSLVDATADSCSGTWKLDAGALVSDAQSRCKLQFPYHPPAEYDFLAEFSREQGNDAVTMILSSAGHHFAWVMGGWKNTTCGFDRIAGKAADENPSTVRSASVFETGKKYVAVVKVRKTGLEAYIDGKVVSQWKTDYAHMGNDGGWSVDDMAALGLGTFSSATRFYRVQVTEITGTGEFTRQLASKSSPSPLIASSNSPPIPGLQPPRATLRPFPSPTTPASPTSPLQPPPTAPTVPSLPFNPNAIERPEFANKPKPIAKNITSITSMMVRVRDDGDTLGLTSDIIAAVAPDTRNSRDGGAGFMRSKVGEEMKTSFDEAVRAVRLRYPTWENGRIDFSFGEKYTEHDGGSAGTAFGVLLLSSLEGFDIDPKCAVTGDITVDWKVRRVAGVASKIHGAILDKCLYAAIPASNEDVINDLPLLYGESSLWDIQVLSIPTLQQAVATLRTDRAPQLAEALSLFATLQPTLAKSGRVALHNPATIDALKRIVQLAPNHLSAKALLAIADNTAPKTLSASASLYRFSIIAYPYRDFLSGRQPINRTTLPAAVTINARKQIEELRRIASKDVQPLITDMAGLIEVAEESAARGSRTTNFDRERDALLAHLAAVSANRELLEKLVREGY